MTLFGSRADEPSRITLHFREMGDRIVTNLSASVRIGDTLFVAGDEAQQIERLRLDGSTAGDHESFALGDLLDIEEPDSEADLEGLAVTDDWLWIIGSHARTRPKVEKAKDERLSLRKLADLRDTRARCLIARVPLVECDDGWKPVRKDGRRRAGMVRQTKHGNALSKALRKDPLLAPFTRIPAKEGGVDIEGIAVCEDRIALGMRGPVIAGHALMLELRFDQRGSGRLDLCGTPCKRLLALDGLGIRDLKRHGEDLLILAGPTTALDGPCTLYRWKKWVKDPPQDADVVRLHRPEPVADIPFGTGCDHPEGLALWDDDGGKILIVNDSPSADRLDDKGLTIACDLLTIDS